MDLTLGTGCLNAQSMIEMNNLAVGYYPREMPEIGGYPPPPIPTPGVLPKAPVVPSFEVERLGSQTRS